MPANVSGGEIPFQTRGVPGGWREVWDDPDDHAVLRERIAVAWSCARDADRHGAGVDGTYSKDRPRPRLSGAPFGMSNPAIRAAASYRPTALTGRSATITSARHLATSHFVQAQMMRPVCQT
jgi:hypothetical protein